MNREMSEISEGTIPSQRDQVKTTGQRIATHVIIFCNLLDRIELKRELKLSTKVDRKKIRQNPCCHSYEPDVALARPFTKPHPLDVKMRLGTVYLWAGFLPENFWLKPNALKEPSAITLNP